MNIRKIYAILCCLFLTVLSVNAQQYMNVYESNYASNVIPTSQVKYATFKCDNSWFKITNGSAEVKESSFSASCTVALATSSTIKTLATTPEIGVCYSRTNTTPTTKENCQTLGTALKNYQFTVSGLSWYTTYYYRVYVKLGVETFYGDVCNVKTLYPKTADNSKTINGHKFIDLGLPSGILWAETNIGAEVAYEGGDYFAWGETQTKDTYIWSTYKFGTSTKYNSSFGAELEKTDDAAYINWGYPCRMPTQAQFEELCNTDNCTWTWTSMTSPVGEPFMGYRVESVKNGNSIFLPASGYRYESYLNYHGSYGYYWSSTLRGGRTSDAFYLGFYSGNFGSYSDYYRYYGRTVRPVAEQ